MPQVRASQIRASQGWPRGPFIGLEDLGYRFELASVFVHWVVVVVSGTLLAVALRRREEAS